MHEPAARTTRLALRAAGPAPSKGLALRAAAAAASGLLYAAAQPGSGAWPLAPVCLVPLLLALRGARPRARALLGWIAGTLATGVATLGAGAAGAESYYGLSLPAAIAVALAVGQLFGAATFVLFALLAGDPARRAPIAAALGAGGALALAELARCTLLTGFPWLLLAYGLQPVPALAQDAAIAGAIGVSVLLALVNAGIAGLLAPRASARARGAAGLVAACAAAALAGGALLGGEGGVRVAEGAPALGNLRILLVQHAPPLARRSAPADVVAAAERLRALTQGAGELDLAVWSENALPALLPENLHLVRNALAERGAGAVLLGAAHADPERPGTLHTSAFLVGAGGQLLGRHDKVHLLPFAEYAPWPLRASQLGIVAATPGDAPRTLRLGDVGLGPLVCYEVLFAGLARSLVRGGSGVLVNVSNDSWFGATGAAQQHLAAAMYRAIETRRPLVRATHTGISAGIDARGRVVAALPRDVPATLLLDVRPGDATTPYVAWGDLPLWLAAPAMLAASRARRRRLRGGAPA